MLTAILDRGARTSIQAQSNHNATTATRADVVRPNATSTMGSCFSWSGYLFSVFRPPSVFSRANRFSRLARQMKSRGLDAAALPFSQKESCSARNRARSRVYPILDLVRVPRHSAGSESQPSRELPGRLQPGDVRETIRNSVDNLQILLRYELPGHCISLIEEGRCNAPVKPWASRNIPDIALRFNAYIDAHSIANHTLRVERPN